MSMNRLIGHLGHTGHLAYKDEGILFGSTSQLLLDIGLVLFFIALAALFVAAEISLLSLRDSQVRQMQSQGKRGARVGHLTQNPNRFLAAAQIGVTFCGFLSAALGSERLGSSFVIPAFEKWGLSHGLATTLSLVLVTIVIAYISLVFGELVPKRLAIYRTESIALASAGIIDQLAKFFRPTIWLLSKSTDAVVTGHTALTDEERDIVEEVFNSGDLALHEIMVPRTEVEFLDVGTSIDEAMKVAVESAHSRYPVTRGNSDEVIGFLHVRDLLNIHVSRPNATLLDIIRPVTFLPGTKGVLPALTELRAKRQHLAIVLDEYGGTDGIVTLEDLVECFIGDIHDEYDEVEDEVTPQGRTGDFEIDALISEGPYETAGGYVMHALGRLPEVHDVLRHESLRITVLSMEGKRAGQLLISRDEWKDTAHE